MNKVIPWYKMYDFVKSQPPEKETDSLKLDYLLESGVLESIMQRYSLDPTEHYFDMTLTRWLPSMHFVPEEMTFGQIKESMDNYMDNQLREAGFKVYLPC